TWRKIDNFSTNSLAAIATSTLYDEQDAIRDYDEFLGWVELLPNLQNAVDKSDFSEVGLPMQAPGGSEVQLPAFSVQDCEIINLDRHHSARKGDICVVENARTVPFDIKRLYYLYDVPADAVRGGHAHKHLYQLLIAASGSFTVRLDDGKEQRSVSLKRPYQALLIKPGIWREVDDFSSGSVCMVLASELYDESDYIRNYQAFIEYKQREL
ncbi:MAG: WxcM-like domain-containing protein, partial [Bacteroidales bacterium]|nr:WxcM-like domain-containing protein [Bacteroidales bacterium]